MIEDLHVHSTMSDGSDTFEQVLEQSAQRASSAWRSRTTTPLPADRRSRELGERLRAMQVVGGIEVSAYDFERGRKVPHHPGAGHRGRAPRAGRPVRAYA